MELSMFDLENFFGFIRFYLMLDETGKCEKALFTAQNNSFKEESVSLYRFKKMYSITEQTGTLVLDKKLFYMFYAEKSDEQSIVDKCCMYIRSIELFKKDENLMKNAEKLVSHWYGQYGKQLDIYATIQEVVGYTLINPRWANPVTNWGKALLNWIKRNADPHYYDRFKKYQKNQGTMDSYKPDEALKKVKKWKGLN